MQENYKKIKREIDELINMELTLLKVKEILEEAEQKPAEQPEKEKDNPEEDESSNNQTMSM